MKSSKNIPITREYGKQQIIDAICAEMTPIETENYSIKGRRVVVETKGNVTIIHLVGLSKKVETKSKFLDDIYNQIPENQKINLQSVKLQFSEKKCKVSIECGFGYGKYRGLFDTLSMLALVLIFVGILIPILIFAGVGLELIAVIIAFVQNKKEFKEFETEIYELIESFL